MPITGRFVADFTAFDAAVKSAQVELQGLESSSVRVEKSLNKMVDQFSGRRLIQDANLMVEAVERIGGASQLTQKELEQVGAKATEAAAKMKALGMEVPANMQKLADATKGAGGAASVASSMFAGLAAQVAGMFTIGAVIGFTKAIGDTADQIQKLKLQTGMTAEEVQKLMHISSQTSVNMGSLTSAAQNLQAAIGKGDTGLTAAVKDLGINWADFLELSTYDQMTALASAIAAIEDPTERAGKAAAVFGKNWKEIMPAVLSDMKAVGDAAPQMSDAASKAIDDFMDDLVRLKDSAKANLGDVIGSILGAKKALDDWAGPSLSITGSWDQMINTFDAGNAKAKDLAATLAASKAPVIDYGGALNTAAISGQELIEVEAKLAADLVKSQAANKAAADAAKDRATAEAAAMKELENWAAVYGEVTAYGNSYQEALAEIDTHLVDHVQTLLAAGQSADTLAKAYSLTGSAMRAIQADLAAQTREQKLAGAAAAETARLYDELYTLQISRSGTAAEAQIANVHRWGEEYKRRLAQAGTDTKEAYDAIDAIVKEKTDSIGINWQHIDSISKTSLQGTADEALKTYQYMISGVEEFKVADILAMEETARAAQDAADAWGTAFEAGADRATAAAKRASDAAKASAKEVMSWSDAMEKVASGEGTMTGLLGPTGPGTMTNYGPWGSDAHRAAITKAYAAGRYFGPVKTRGAGSGYGPGYGGQSYMPDFEALGFKAKGGPVTSGMPYMVGEQGPEMFVPDDSGTILPHGVPLGGGDSVQVTNVFHINGTAQDVARAVMAEITRTMRVGRKWPAV